MRDRTSLGITVSCTLKHGNLRIWKGWNLSRDGISQGMESIMGWNLSWDGNYQEMESLKGWHLSRDKIY